MTELKLGKKKKRKKKSATYTILELLLGSINKRKEALTMYEYRRVKEHYEIYLDGVFVCSCDVGELRETLDELRA